MDSPNANYKKFKSKEKRKHTDATERVGSMVKLSKLISNSKDVGTVRMLWLFCFTAAFYNVVFVVMR